jgi:hypothetical protein
MHNPYMFIFICCAMLITAFYTMSFFNLKRILVKQAFIIYIPIQLLNILYAYQKFLLKILNMYTVYVYYPVQDRLRKKFENRRTTGSTSRCENF